VWVLVSQICLRVKSLSVLLEQHHERLVGEDHAGGMVVGEARIERESQRREEVDGPLQVADREIDEQLAGRMVCIVFLLGHFGVLALAGMTRERARFRQRYRRTRRAGATTRSAGLRVALGESSQSS